MLAWAPWIGLAVAVLTIAGLILYLVWALRKEARRSGATKERAEALAGGKRKLAEAARKKARRTRRRGSDALDRL